MTTEQNRTSHSSQARKERQLKTRIRHAAVALAAATILATGTTALAATNTATDPGGGGVTLAASGAVTVNSSSLQLVKQVWNGAGTACLASQPADATYCNGGATSITVPAGTSLQFLIFVRNTSDVALTDVRFQDVLNINSDGFTYTTGSIKRTPNDGTAPLDTDTATTIHTAANGGTTQTDTVDPAVDYASYNAGTLTVGAVTGQINMSLGFPAHRSFGIVFTARKN